MTPWAPTALEPITELRELTSAVEAMISYDPARGPALLERVLEAVIHWMRTDPAALATALDVPSLRERVASYAEHRPYGCNHTIYHAVAAVAAVAAGGPALPRHPPDLYPEPTVEHLVVDRLFALAEHMQTGASSYPVSRPTSDNGLIAPGDLLARLRSAAAERVDVWPIELEQALLRLAVPTEADARRRLADDLSAIKSAAGAIAATWVSVGLPVDPALTMVKRLRAHLGHDGQAKKQWSMSVISVSPVRPAEPASVIWRGLIETDPAPFVSGHYGDNTGARPHVPWLAPRHRELLAAHITDRTVTYEGTRNVSLPLLPALAAADGPFGEAMALALVYGYSSERDDARAQAVDATVTLGDRKILEPELVGRLAGSLAVERTIVVARLVAALRMLAGRGADDTAWAIARNALPQLLAVKPTVAGTAELLGLAADVVERTGSGGAVVGLDTFAAGKGSSRQLVEARRLSRLLGPAR